MYKGQRKIRKELKESQGLDPVLSNKTLSYGGYSKGRIDWEDFEDITSKPSSSTARPHGKDNVTADDDDTPNFDEEFEDEDAGEEQEESEESEESEDDDDFRG